MKLNRKNLLFVSSAAIILTLASQSAQATTFYWDSTPTPATPGFGTAAGTWTSQSVTSGSGRWVTSATGIVAGSASQATTNADTFNYGTATDGLAAGTVTIGGTLATPINVGSITFGSASGAINLSGGFLAFGASKFITVNNTTNTIGSVIQGANGFTKNGTGALILTGNNTYTGQTTIANDGSLTLSGNNSAMTGNVVLSTASGTGPRLNINSATAIGSGTLSFGGGAASDAVRIDNTSGGAVTLTSTNAITLNRNFTFIGTQNLTFGTGTATLGGLTTGTSRSISVTANTLTFSGTIAETVANLGINKNGAGTLVLAASNTYSGSTKVSNGILSLGHSGALTNSAFDTTSIAGTGSVGLSTTVTTLTMGGLTGANNLSTRFTTTGGYTGLTALTLNPGASLSHTYSGDIGNGAGAMTLTKSGAGTQILSGTNSHTGATGVSAGVLAVNGNITTSNVAVSGTGTLQGSGSIGGTVTIQSGGTLAAGNSIESLGTGNLAFDNGSTFAYELQTSLYAGTPNDAGDLTYSTGTLDITAGATLTLSDLATSTALVLGNKLTLISYFGGWTSGELFTYDAATLSDGDTFTLGANTWEFNYDDTTGGPNFSSDQTGATRFVTMTVVPEPRAALLGGLGMLALLRRRRQD